MPNSPSPPPVSTLRLDRQDPYLRVLCINIFVRDQDRSLRFYVDQLGFGLVMDESYESAGRWVAVAPLMAAPFWPLSLRNGSPRNISLLAVPNTPCLLPKTLMLNLSSGASRACAFITHRR